MDMIPPHRQLFRLLVAVVLVVLVAAACGDDDDAVSTGPGTDDTTPSPGEPATGPAALGDGEWVLVRAEVSGSELDLVASHPVTLQRRNGEVGGTAACNSYFGAISDGELLFEGFGQTEMACDPPSTMELESAYLQAMTMVTSAVVDGEALVLTGDGVELRFEPVAPIADAELVGTEWLLDTLIDGDTASSIINGTDAALRFADDGTVSGSDGCNGFSSTYEVDGDTLRFGLMAMTTRGCPEDVAIQAAAVGAVLAADPTIEIDGDRLTLSAPDGTGLVYLAG